MTLHCRPVLPGQVAALCALKVRPDQRDLVAPNALTLQEVPDEPGGHVWGLWSGDDPVGLMAMVEPADVRENGPFHDPRAAYLWRLMIAVDRQGQGHGGHALDHAVAQARDWGAPRLLVGINPAPHGNRGFYERFGFRDTGATEEGDRLLVLDLSPPAQEFSSKILGVTG